MRKHFTSAGLWSQGVVLIRLFLGALMIKYGIEVFDKKAMDGYTEWLTDLHFPMPRVMAFLGKLAELGGGISLVLGLLTRWMMIPLAITMIVITFVMQDGKIFGENEHTFLLLLLTLFFCFAGPGKWSLDYLLFDSKKRSATIK